MFFEATVFWEAFTELSSSRQVGMGIGGIPYSEVTDYLNENDIFSMEQRQRYRHFINFIDALYISIKSTRDEKG